MTDLFDQLRAWEACEAPHGTITRYLAGCRCHDCKTDKGCVTTIYRANTEGVGHMGPDGRYLPRPPAGDWAEHAACRGVNPEVFYADEHEAEARALCARCPVTQQCLEHAIATDERWGIRGGMKALERQRLVKGVRMQCAWCGTPFPHKGTRRKYCSDRCRDRMNQERAR